jgi:adenylyltransferase/sulfurtransferase
MLDDVRVARFARQLLVPGMGEAAQERLAAARVRIVGADVVASAALVSLAQAGVGKLWIDDPGTVSPQELGGWLHAPAAIGQPRTDAVRDALARLSRFVAVEPYPAGGVPSAALVVAASAAQALRAAETARRARIPHAVVEADADGGSVVSVPPGAPCYACARSTANAGRPPFAGAAALSALAAAELVHMIAMPGSIPGRRIELLRGVATVRLSARLAGCACAADAGSEPGAGGGPSLD